MASYTHYWAGSTCDAMYGQGYEGKALDHTAGSQFKRKGVKAGDRIYVVNVTQGQLVLVGRMIVGKIVHSDAEAERLLGYEPWSAPDHIIEAPDTGTPMRFERVVSPEVAKALRFVNADGKIVSPKFVSDTELDRQTLRGVRQLTEDAAAALDRILHEEG